MINWDNYPNFSEKEFACSHTGECDMREDFLDALQTMRGIYDKPMTITSGYRHPTHPIEAKKSSPGAHTTGCAADIACSGAEAYELLQIAFELGFTGIGVSQKGSARFIHLDMLETPPRPNVWSY
jgi:zinc D-Ala-D-Ala carboxypeptidase